MARYLLRFVRNLRCFGLYYRLILWNILLKSFVPWSKVSLILLVVITIVHAFLRISDDPSLDGKACAAGELLPLVHRKTGDVDIESQASV